MKSLGKKIKIFRGYLHIGNPFEEFDNWNYPQKEYENRIEKINIQMKEFSKGVFVVITVYYERFSK